MVLVREIKKALLDTCSADPTMILDSHHVASSCGTISTIHPKPSSKSNEYMPIINHDTAIAMSIIKGHLQVNVLIPDDIIF